MSGERIRRLTVEPMSEASFARYGELFDSQQRPADSRLIVETGFEGEGRITASVIWQPSGGRRFTRLERHYAVTQAFVQLSGSPAVVCAAAPTNLDDPASVPRPEDVRAFLIDPAIGYAFHRGTWHSLDRYLLGAPGATFLILNVDPNPTQIVDYATGDGLIYADLDKDPEPTRTRHDDVSGISFELAL